MKRRWNWLLPAALLIAGLAVGARTQAAGGGYTLVRAVADQSSVFSVQNSTYQLQGSLGQPFAGTATVGQIWLGAEYWYGAADTAPTARKLYLALIRR
jgi:hypothetical protein